MQIYKVGGAVRDRLLGRTVSEVDWLVVGATPEEMQAHGFRPVGADFPVFLHPQTGEEYALARTERKSGRGYGGFTFHASPDVTLEEDLQRRDLTINAIAEDDNGQLIDPYGGQSDLQARLLRHVSPAFAEDPLRVLRVARFAARYAELGFRIADETLELMRQLARSGELSALTAERSWKEISRALMEPRPDVFIQVLQDCDALPELFPELAPVFVTAGTDAEQLLGALHQCAAHYQPLPVRWACLLLGCAAQDKTRQKRLAAIDALNQRCKAPRDCQELAMLLGRYHDDALDAKNLQADTLLDMLQHFDIYRRPERFEQFIAACEMYARAVTPDQPFPPADFLRGAASTARAVAVKPLLDQGLKGADLGKALSAARLEAVKVYCQRSS
ncbi:multifunctional CCA addition/repair protein [Pseudomonas songnenensis]|uniref:CCA-adding enzyme n=1 Tax=Pseudomonas songnenensis TaxID=1176259 RepID=A0ABX9UT36_9PSED|nr:multifunctional CCA addition/repair protein [Pseudomonas songnenensis]MCQ4298659.1 multifunctional CCA addition/repair protein [Pseudomonas songnenensis]RMH96513.1 multifunctional CCA addition/repair protein [Pseudomonas songnenensis]